MMLLISILLFMQSEAKAALSNVDKAIYTQKNLLANPGFESGTSAWSITGGSAGVANLAAVVGSGTFSGYWDPSAANQKLLPALITGSASTEGKQGVFSCSFMTLSAPGQYTIQSSLNAGGYTTLATFTVEANYARASGFVQMPDTGDTLQFAINATGSDEPQIFIDDCFLGLATEANPSYLVSDKGSLLVGGAQIVSGQSSNFLQELLVGTDGYYLAANSSDPTGLTWTAFPTVPPLVQISGLKWVEGVNAPTPAQENLSEVYVFDDELTQQISAVIKVPTAYVAGSQIELKLPVYSSATSGTLHFKTQTTLIRNDTDPVTSTTNQRTSTNSAITMSGSNNDQPLEVTFDLTSNVGQINAVNVAPSDVIVIRLYRDTDTSTLSARAMVHSSEIEF